MAHAEAGRRRWRPGPGLWAPAILFIVTVGLGGGALVGYLWNAKNRLQDEAMVQNARIYAESLRIIQDYYASEILPGIDPDVVDISHDFRQSDNTLPFPATLAIDFSQHLSRIDADFAAAMLSDYPYPWREDRLLTRFDQRALDAVIGNGGEYTEFTDENGRRVVHFAAPIRMQANCVACHNSHPQSPKTDWQVGDIRGIHVVEFPVTPLVSGMQVEFAYLVAWTAVAAALSGGVIALLRSRENRALGVLETRNRELVSANAEKDRANQAKAEFLANISHEVRTPMNGILGLVDLMIQDGSASRNQGRLRRLQITGQSLLHVINDVLDFSKIEAGKMTFETIAFDLDQVLDSATGLYDIEPKTNDAPRLYVSLDPDLPSRVVGDPYRVTQVITNLLSNAFKFTQRGHIILSVMRDPDDDGLYRLTVTDTGPGIDPEVQKQLFQPFSQAERSTSRRFGGTGLGLAISTNLAQGMGGALSLVSTPGQGSSFTMTLPLVPAPDRAPAPQQMLPTWLKRLSLYDEDPLRQDLQVTMLQSLGLPVEILGSTAEVEAHIDDLPEDEVLLVNLEQHHDQTFWARCAAADQPRCIALYPPGFEAAQTATDALSRPVMARKLVERLSQMDAGPSEKPMPAPADGPGRDLPRLPHLHVLVVDDNELNRMIAQAFLEQGGASTQIAASGPQAIEATQHERFDLVLMDIQMPEMDGYETARRIRADHPDLKIVALTANAQPQDRERSLREGFADHLVKPLSRNALYAALGKLHPAEGASEAPTSPTALFAALQAQGVDTGAGIGFAGEDPGLYCKVLHSFAGSGGDLVAPFQTALATGETGTAMRLAHTMKSLLRLIGMAELGQQAAEMEASLKRGDRPSEADLARFVATYDTLRTTVQAHEAQD